MNQLMTFCATSAAIARELKGMDYSSAPFAPVGVTVRPMMVNFMFSDADQDLSGFGRVARDDFFNDRA
jgi:hypothetical protein